MTSYLNPAAWAGVITSVLGDPRPYGGHEGIDIAPTGSGPFPVVAAAAGKVEDAGYMPDGYGYYVKIKHDDGRMTLYGHFAEPPAVARGDKVAQGQQIGIAGSTGYSTGTHLHFSIIDEDGKYLNPIDFVDFSVPGAVKQAVSDFADSIRQEAEKLLGDDPCARHAIFGAEYYKNCRERHGLPVEPGQHERVLEALEVVRDPSPSLGMSDLPAQIVKAISSDIITPLKNAALNTITWPFRAMINTMQLSDTPLTTGAETVAWLQQPENQRLYIASQAALALVLVLIVVSVGQFLREPAKTVIKTAANPVSAAADML